MNMVPATHEDIVRIVPGIQDHTIVEILDLQAAVDDLEAAVQLLQNDDEGLIAARQRRGDRINRLVAILRQSELRPADTIDR